MSGYIALVHKDEGTSYGVSFPDVLGCISTGDTFEDAVANAAEALAFHFAGMREDGDTIPAPRSFDELKRDPEFVEKSANATVTVIEPRMETTKGKKARTWSRDLTARLRLLTLRARHNWLIILVIFVGGALIFGGQIAHSIKEVRELIWPKADALSLVREETRDDVSREFVETAWRRVYWSRNFLARLSRRAPSAEINEAWKKLLTTVEEMSAKTMIYAASFELFYNNARRVEFEDGIQSDFRNVTQEIVDLRYSNVVKKLEFGGDGTELTEPEAGQIKTRTREIEEKLDKLQIRLYQFVRCFDKQHQTLTSCQY